ncbi:succinate-semialdehyde dehydrogenase [Klebsiella pneumoniae]|nr:succinate-semialdehyde dehydrogenase [Klebsiella pneumoniae]SBH05624.1 succinate-semialdehyde dehydrogenase [Klebsiella pneumoniae]VAQ30745.1 succinate-semialdehyde dehydrogenase [Klebsiella pneumoniae]VAR80827.1 succinate-semialdehyde dehydrogenase [Klebsiella pneumoniae]VAR92947.1 succinate-semialdehyde dehydrogenase [Klebsiella pneumoniae]
MMNLSATHAVSVNPTTGEVVSSLPWASEREVDAAITLAAAGYRQWRQTPLADRADALRRIGAALRARGEEVAQMITLEMGKPIAQARGEVAKSANLCDWYAEHGPAMLATEATLVENNQAVIEYRPLGAILAVMPWNFPVWQVMRGAVPILLAGNSYLLKHAPNVMGSARLLGEIFAAAGLPDGVFGWVNATNDGVSQIINDDRIAAVTVTGSVRAGKAIGAQAGAALKKCVLELGGSDPFIVLNDADLDEAVKAAVTGRYQNSGQVCAASKRFILEAGIAEAFTRKFVDAVAALKMGDPRDEQNYVGPMARFDLRDEQNYVGPMARFDLRDELHQQVTATLDEGATLLLGAEKIEGAGNYYAPTVLGNVTAGMTGFRQELFGPVATLTTARDADHALALANDSEFGLSATVYTTDEAQAQRFARELECGGVFLNGYCASDARVAFGGVKKSGFGRELSHFGLHEFCNAQTVWKDRR